jgi:hypothetical protein
MRRFLAFSAMSLVGTCLLIASIPQGTFTI